MEKLIQKHQNVKLLLVGRGTYTKTLKNLVNKANLQNKILFHGAVLVQSDLAKLLSASEILFMDKSMSVTFLTFPHAKNIKQIKMIFKCFIRLLF